MTHRLFSPARLASPPGLGRLASQCAVCHGWPAEPVCPACIARFSTPVPRCRCCALPMPRLGPDPDAAPALCASCQRRPPPLAATWVAVNYGWPWSDLVTRYKFGDSPGWAGFFAGLLLRSPGLRATLDGLTGDDWILPMPLSAQRLQTRGFNQAWELGCALSRQSRCNARADAGLLLRIRHSRPQTELGQQARRANVRGAYAVDPLRAPLLAGRRVVLVDDVMTSGASLFSAAAALRAAGASEVVAVVFARTPAP